MRFVDRRISGVLWSQTMARAALSVSLVLSGLVLVAQYNAYWSWYRHFAMRDLETGRIEFLRKQVIQQWIESRSLRIPFVDVPILPSDISIVGGGAILGRKCRTTSTSLLARCNRLTSTTAGTFSTESSATTMSLYPRTSSK